MMLKDKVAIVTGGTRGIGFATVKAFLEHGAKVALFGSREETVRIAKEKICEEFGCCDVLGLWPNLMDPTEVKEAINQVKETFGKIDILVNNAGISQRDKLFDYQIEDFEKIMNLNVNAVFILSKEVAPIMKEQGGGVILNTSSMVSLYGQAAGVGYPTSKYAVNGMTRSLARELGKDNIRVNAVAPGVIKTDMVANLPEQIIQPIINSIPLHRIGEPEDVANAFVFLASDMASYITGVVLSVDGATMS